MTDDKALDLVRKSYKWAIRDHPNADVCPNCHGEKTVTVYGQVITCPCQEPKAQTSTPKRSLTNPLQLKSADKAKVTAQIATSDPRWMDVAIEPLDWYYDDITTQLHGCVLGMTGSGKTNSVYRIVEQILRVKGLVTIIDPEGDYRFLKTEYPILIVGKGRKGNPIDIPVVPDNAATLARSVVHRNISIIIDLSGYDEEAKNIFLAEYLGELWRQYQDDDLPPMRLVIDEVQLFAPQNTQTDSKKLILDIASRGRKRHLALLIATQRPQRVDKTLLDATDIRIFHRLKYGAALNAVRELLPGQIGEMRGKEILDLFPKMARGQASFEMEGHEPQFATIKPSDTYHPQTGAPTQLSIPLTTIDADLLADLRRVLGSGPEVVVNSGIIRTQNLTEYSSQVQSALEAEIERLRGELSGLSELLEQKDAEIAALTASHDEDFATLHLSRIKGEPIILEARSPLATDRAIRKQRREFDQFKTSLTHQMAKHHRAMLKFLLENDTNTYSIYEVARFVGYSVSTIASDQPRRLIAEGYIWRQKGRKPMYKSTVRSRLAQAFPDLNTEGLVGEILRTCK